MLLTFSILSHTGHDISKMSTQSCVMGSMTSAFITGECPTFTTIGQYR